MQKQSSIFLGVLLILAGGLSLVLSLVPGSWYAQTIAWGVSKTWPVVVISLGSLLIVPAIALRSKALMALWVLGFPILTTGCILVLTNTTNWWNGWEYLWPLEVLSLAAAFLLIAIFTRGVWALIPAILFGVNGLVMQFCAVTGWWEAWSFLWPVEPLALGLAFLAMNFKVRSTVLSGLGVVFIGFSIVSFIGMGGILAWSWLPLRLLGPGLLILLGGGLLLSALLRRPSQSSSQMVAE